MEICFQFLGNMPRSGIARLCYSSMCSFLRNHQPVFHCAQSYIPPVTPISSHPCTALLSSVFLITAILMGRTWYLIVFLVCISQGLTMLHLSHVLTGYLGIFFREMSIQILICFLMELFVFFITEL